MSTRRPPGWEDGDAFIRRCPLCKRATMARGLADAQKRNLAASFANAHYRHHKELTGGAPVHRCALCGLMLLFDHRCPAPRHLYEAPVLWTEELAAAYREVVDTVAAAGERAVVPWGRGEYAQAYNLARLWGMRPVADAPADEGVA